MLKNRIRLLALFTLLLGYTATASPTDVEDRVVDTLNTEELREVVKLLSENVKSKDSPSVTAADVADKALVMLGSAVGNIANKLKEISPEVWRIMVRQQYAKAAATLVYPLSWAFGALFISVILRKFLWKTTDITARREALKNRVYQDGLDDEQFIHTIVTGVVPLLIVAIALIVTGYHAAEAISWVINPEFYAIRDIFILVLKPTALL